MREIIPKDSRYIPLVQQRSSCAAACILMVMYKRGIPLVPQELLGYHLGLIVNLKNKHLFWNARTGKKPTAGFGTQIFSKRYDPNEVFKKLKIRLKLKVHPVSIFSSETAMCGFLIDAVKKNKDVLVCFDHKVLSKSEKQVGHVCVIDQIYPKKNLVRIIDPAFNQPKWRLVSITTLKRAMDLHPAHHGGFWELFI